MQLTKEMKRIVLEQRLGFHATVCPDGTRWSTRAPPGTEQFLSDPGLSQWEPRDVARRFGSDEFQQMSSRLDDISFYLEPIVLGRLITNLNTGGGRMTEIVAGLFISADGVVESRKSGRAPT